MEKGQENYDLDAFDFELPEEQIAQRPAQQRDASRLLVVDRNKESWSDHRFYDLPDFLSERDALVLNDTKVIPARLVGRRSTGGRAELLLIEKRGDGAWVALAKPGRKLREGAVVDFGSGREARIEAVLDGGKRQVRLFAFDEEIGPADEKEWLATVGQAPLPPYIRRESGPEAFDRKRYQTVYASREGAVAAPTAGLHFTPELLERLRKKGVSSHEITLHVGYGTFEPVRADDLRAHRVAPEHVTITAETATALNAVRENGGRIVAVGTTTTRTLETSADEHGRFSPFEGKTSLTIIPGYSFCGVDTLITNFHLPRSSLLVLVGVFAGRKFLLEAYRYAVKSGYRFYSYGDSMLIL